MNQITKLLIVCFIFANKAEKSSNKFNLLVKVDEGLVKGHIVNTTSSVFNAWQGIPYAKPPLNELRFREPEAIEKWNNTLIANISCSKCVQSDGSGSEDCLCVEVYSPINKKCPKVMPVMVWIHGGAFVDGDANLNSTNPEYIMKECVILVHLQYRLGLIGFLSMGNTKAPGNNGLKDQALALKWVKKNIRFFNGDQNKITIFGESAGAASVSYHILSPMSKGLFHKAILQSGTSLCQWTLTRGSSLFALSVAMKLNITVTSTSELLDEFRKVPAKQLHKAASVISAEKTVVGNALGGLPIGPVIEPSLEGAFLTGKSQDMLSKGEFNRVPTIIGHNSLEALAAFTSENILMMYVKKYELDKAELTPVSMNAQPGNKLIAGSMIYNRYFGAGPMTMNHLPEFISLDQFNKCIIKTIQLQARYADTYYYVFSHMGQLGYPGIRPFNGVGHGEDVSYIFPNKLLKNVDYADSLTSRRVIRMWTNFAIYGKPTIRSDKTLEGMRWPKVSSTGLILPYLNINTTMNVALEDLKEVFFYDVLYKFFGQGPFDCY
ncbi:unnamed protein product [Brassicogethes aeneus]|uniref:Carboxylesterase type B domain-containing protein n=1 Tax=Brassicogethes aeneus TaxID=1431903 RepID=A0A9P0BCE6_BRAAE|nr:unnamed protein product [Brassicogethes aeneus]